ncbi:glutaredoxin family protein [Peribacillus sp. NPDC097675]|uniref:glutaredoxin family protein n=1 Tax=Peribacillus sp. NPDC097675 TaxID=3390618 RepID=UPI003CFEA967
MEKDTLILYSREKCPLCVKAKQILEELKQESELYYKEIDIHSDDVLLEKYGLMIPVIEMNGRIIQYGNVDISTLQSFLVK